MRCHRIFPCVCGLLACAGSAPAQQNMMQIASEPSGTSLLGDYSFAGRQNRTLQTGGWTLRQRLTPRLFAWYGQQNILATGSSGATHFTADTSRVGAQWGLSRSPLRGWTLGYNGYLPSNARLVTPSNHIIRPGEVTRVQYPSTQTNVLTARYAFGRALPDAPTSRVAPTYSVFGGYSRVDAVGTGADALLVGGGALFQINSRLTADVEATGYAERAGGSTISKSFKSYMNASLAYHPVRWATLIASADIMPFGMPYGGTSLSGFSGYLLYQPGTFQAIQSGPIANFNVQLQFSNHF